MKNSSIDFTYLYVDMGNDCGKFCDNLKSYVDRIEKCKDIPKTDRKILIDKINSTIGKVVDVMDMMDEVGEVTGNGSINAKR